LRLDKELENILNDDANAWLLEQWSEKSKCALAFDEGDSRYGIMTTNISEVFNFVLKGALYRFLESWIIFLTSVTSTSLIGGRKHDSL
jgi:hypothetical protein